jgi:hypothetical protein
MHSSKGTFGRSYRFQIACITGAMPGVSLDTEQGSIRTYIAADESYGRNPEEYRK